MTLDIRTLLVAATMEVMINSMVLALAWHSEKKMRTIIGFWGISQFLLGIGMMLVALQGTVPLFLGVVISNICMASGLVAEQRGIFCYIGKKQGYLKSVFLVIYIGVAMWFFSYIYISLAYRIVAFCLGSMIFSLIFIITLMKSDKIREEPIKLLAVTHICEFGVMGTRAVVALLQKDYYLNSYLDLSGAQAILLVTLSACHISRAVGYFWSIMHRLGLEMQKQAVTDELTGLPNRRAFVEYFDKLIVAKTSGLGIAIIDVDKFKEINDQYGHLAGDRYLKQICNLFKAELGTSNCVFRYGGDEFIAIIHDIDKEEMLYIMEKVRSAAVDLKIQEKGKTVQSTLSIGITLAVDEVNYVDELISKADNALYLVKKEGGNKIAIL